jgi:hypothetical protein
LILLVRGTGLGWSKPTTMIVRREEFSNKGNDGLNLREIPVIRNLAIEMADKMT